MEDQDKAVKRYRKEQSNLHDVSRVDHKRALLRLHVVPAVILRLVDLHVRRLSAPLSYVRPSNHRWNALFECSVGGSFRTPRAGCCGDLQGLDLRLEQHRDRPSVGMVRDSPRVNLKIPIICYESAAIDGLRLARREPVPLARSSEKPIAAQAARPILLPRPRRMSHQLKDMADGGFLTSSSVACSHTDALSRDVSCPSGSLMTTRKGGALATKTAEIQGKGIVLPVAWRVVVEPEVRGVAAVC